MLINYQGGSTALRKIVDAFNVYAKGIPQIEYHQLDYEGSKVHFCRIHPDDNTVVTLDYAGDVPKILTEIRNQWFIDKGYRPVVQLSGAYFDNHPGAATYGRPVGALLHNWSTAWEKHKGYDCLPTAGHGYPTVYSDGFSLRWIDGWESDFHSLLGKMSFARGVGQSLTINGRVDCSVGEENGRYNQEECVAMIGIAQDGDWIFAINTVKGLNHLCRAYLMQSIGAVTSFDLDGGGSTHLWIDDSLISNQKEGDSNMSNSSLVNYTLLSPNHSGLRKYPISRITIHHMAGNLSVEQCGQLFQNRAKQGSSNYGIGTDGRVGLYVEEKNRAWTSASYDNDNRAVTIEVANDEIGGIWHVSDTTLEKCIQLCVDICRRNGLKQLTYTGDTSGSLTMHCWFANTACPGPYLKSKFPYIAQEVTRRLNADTPAPTPTGPATYKVQIGAFSKKENADALAAKAKAAGFTAIVKEEK